VQEGRHPHEQGDKVGAVVGGGEQGMEEGMKILTIANYAWFYGSLVGVAVLAISTVAVLIGRI